jgi:hypothetical protein
MSVQQEFDSTELDDLANLDWESQSESPTSAYRAERLNRWMGFVLCVVAIAAALAWLCINSGELAKQCNAIAEWWNKPFSEGEWITGRTWKEEKARREKGGHPKAGPFDEALWPESKDDPLAIEPLVIDYPEQRDWAREYSEQLKRQLEELSDDLD